MGLKLSEIREKNLSRAIQSYGHDKDLSSAGLGTWGSSLAGEYGEVAEELKDLLMLILDHMKTLKSCDTIKKSLFHLKNDNNEEYNNLIIKLRKELADVVLYTDLLSSAFDIDLESAVVEKFNEKSRRKKSDIFFDDIRDPQLLLFENIEE